MAEKLMMAPTWKSASPVARPKEGKMAYTMVWPSAVMTTAPSNKYCEYAGVFTDAPLWFEVEATSPVQFPPIIESVLEQW